MSHKGKVNELRNLLGNFSIEKDPQKVCAQSESRQVRARSESRQVCARSES